MNSKGKRPSRKIRKGIVKSAAMDKTIVVEVKRRFRHALYKKVIQARNTFVAHDEKNTAASGDVVEIMETRPLSRTKRWRLTRILKAAASSGEKK